MNIDFPAQAIRSEFARDSVSFPAVVDGKPVVCIVSAEYLTTKFHCSRTEADLMKTAARTKNILEELARERIEAGSVDANGEVLITTETCPR